MQENFASPVLPFTLKYEGGRVDDPRDPGGRTNQGVTQKSYAPFRRGLGLAAADVYAMSAGERDAIYHDAYWRAVGGDDLPAGVDLACFDLGVNSGPARARSYLAEAGGLAKAAADPPAAVKVICARRLSFLHGLRTFEIFGRGWTARVANCEALGVKMALHARVGQPATDPPTRGTALVLDAEARAARAAAARQGKAAQGTGAGGVAAGAAAPTLSAGAAPHSGSLVLVLAGIVLAGIAFALAWRAYQQRMRAMAFAAAASA